MIDEPLPETPVMPVADGQDYPDPQAAPAEPEFVEIDDVRRFQIDWTGNESSISSAVVTCLNPMSDVKVTVKFSDTEPHLSFESNQPTEGCFRGASAANLEFLHKHLMCRAKELGLLK